MLDLCLLIKIFLKVVTLDNLLLLVALYDHKFINKLLSYRFSREWLTWQDALYIFEVTDRFVVYINPLEQLF